VSARSRTALLGLSVGLVLADSAVVTLALPDILRRFDTEIGEVSRVLTSYNAILALGAIPAAYLAQRRPKQVAVTGIVVFGVASAVCGLAGNFNLLLGARCIQAVGGALLITAALELLSITDGDAAAARIDADGHPAGMPGAGRLDEGGIGQRHGAQDDAAKPSFEPAVDRVHVADAAAELDRDVDRAEDRPHRRLVHRAPGEGPVEVDDVQPAAAGGCEAARLVGGIAVVDGGGVHLAAQQADALPVLEVDRRKEDHAASSSSGPSSRLK